MNNTLDLDEKYTHQDVNIVRSFYEFFDSQEKLIDWMKKRPNPNLTVYEELKDSKIVVVIPTINRNSNLALNCINNIYSELTTVLVESGRTKLFNYARSVNLGVKRAMRLEPNWIIISNDDVIKIDTPNKLVSELNKLDHNVIKTVFTNPPGRYHSVEHGLCKPRSRIFSLLSRVSARSYDFLSLYKKFNIEWTHAPPKYPYRFFFNDFHKFILTVSFSIFSSTFIAENDGKLFDETYINGVEDIDLSYQLNSDPKNYAFVDFKISEKVGASLGRNEARELRDIANLSYLNKKLREGTLRI